MSEEQRKLFNLTPDGFGDVIKVMTKSMGIPSCGGCEKRQKYLNEKFPFKEIDDPRTSDDRENIRQP